MGGKRRRRGRKDRTRPRPRIRLLTRLNLGVLPATAAGATLADVVAPIGTIDTVLGSVDRRRGAVTAGRGGTPARPVSLKVRAMATVAGPPTAPPAQRVGLGNVSRTTYESLLADHLDHSVPHVADDRGVLEIVRPSTPHEEDNRALALLVEVVAEESGIDLQNVGPMTF